jgi:hypothetical protein
MISTVRMIINKSPPSTPLNTDTATVPPIVSSFLMNANLAVPVPKTFKNKTLLFSE